MIGLAPSVFKGAASAPDPIAIFGANLTAWYDAAVGVTTNGLSPDRVTNWTDQSGAGGSCGVATPLGPKYVASDTDGTPSVWFDPTEAAAFRVLNFAAGFTVTPLTTCYALLNLNAVNGLPDMMLWSSGGACGFATRWLAQDPTVFDGTAYSPVTFGAGWVVIRWGGSNGAVLRRVSLDAGAQFEAAGSWEGASPDWTQISRGGSAQHFRGYIKQIVMTDTFVANVDAQHAAMLAYFKSRYPTLVTY